MRGGGDAGGVEGRESKDGLYSARKRKPNQFSSRSKLSNTSQRTVTVLLPAKANMGTLTTLYASRWVYFSLHVH